MLNNVGVRCDNDSEKELLSIREPLEKHLCLLSEQDFFFITCAQHSSSSRLVSVEMSGIDKKRVFLACRYPIYPICDKICFHRSSRSKAVDRVILSLLTVLMHRWRSEIVAENSENRRSTY